MALAVVACMTLAGCGEEEDDGVTYGDDVRVLFNRRCTTCHRPVSPINVDIQNPFAPEVGLVNSVNSWADPGAYPGETDERNVVPFDPEASFLIDKLTGDLPTNGHGGAPMPLQIERVTADELAALEQWIADGARPEDFQTAELQRIFGSEENNGLFFSGKCVFCHYAGAPNPLDLNDPFGPDGLVTVGTDGIEGVDASYRGNTKRVVPGDPEASFLIQKVRAERANSEIGAPMPYSYEPLTDAQVDTVRQWIAEGARP